MRRGSSRRQFEAFVAEASDGLVRTGYLMTWDLAETEDLVQETFLRVARRWDRVRTMDHPVAYARRILVNLVLDGSGRRSRDQRELASLDDVVARLVDENAQRAVRGVDDASEFEWALAALPRQERAVLVLRYWHDLPEREIARLLGCSVGTVKKTASRGVNRLRRARDPDIPPLRASLLDDRPVPLTSSASATTKRNLP